MCNDPTIEENYNSNNSEAMSTVNSEFPLVELNDLKKK